MRIEPDLPAEPEVLTALGDTAWVEAAVLDGAGIEVIDESSGI